jgi:hypothetical protein
VYRGLWHGTPVAIKRWFNPQLQEDVQEEFRWGSSHSLGVSLPQSSAFLLKGRCFYSLRHSSLRRSSVLLHCARQQLPGACDSRTNSTAIAVQACPRGGLQQCYENMLHAGSVC